jgi:hypothetical protein
MLRYPLDPVVEVRKVVSFVLWLTFIPFLVSIVFSSVRRGRRGERGISHPKVVQIVCENVGVVQACSVAKRDRQGWRDHSPFKLIPWLPIGVASQWFLGC